MHHKLTKSKLVLIGGTITALLVVAVVFLILIKKEETSINGSTLADLQPKLDFYLVGSIEPAKIVEIKLDKNRGKITEKKVNLNDTVEAGQELFLYSNPEGALAIKEAEQAVTNRTKMLEQAKLQTNMNWEQYNKLTNQVNDRSKCVHHV